VSAKSLTNTGIINAAGGTSTQALINIGSAAGFGTAGALSGAVNMSGDSAIEFVSGTITTIASGASLTMNGASAFIENQKGLGSNSALTTLDFNNGAVSLHNSVHIASSNGFANNAGAHLNIDTNPGRAERMSPSWPGS